MRFGLHPLFSSSPKAARRLHQRRSPLVGSAAPLTHASWWLPWMIHSSGKLAAVDARDDVVERPVLPVEASLRCTFAGPGPM